MSNNTNNRKYSAEANRLRNKVKNLQNEYNKTNLSYNNAVKRAANIHKNINKVVENAEKNKNLTAIRPIAKIVNGKVNYPLSKLNNLARKAREATKRATSTPTNNNLQSAETATENFKEGVNGLVEATKRISYSPVLMLEAPPDTPTNNKRIKNIINKLGIGQNTAGKILTSYNTINNNNKPSINAVTGEIASNRNKYSLNTNSNITASVISAATAIKNKNSANNAAVKNIMNAMKITNRNLAIQLIRKVNNAAGNNGGLKNNIMRELKSPVEAQYNITNTNSINRIINEIVKKLAIERGAVVGENNRNKYTKMVQMVANKSENPENFKSIIQNKLKNMPQKSKLAILVRLSKLEKTLNNTNVNGIINSYRKKSNSPATPANNKRIQKIMTNLGIGQNTALKILENYSSRTNNSKSSLNNVINKLKTMRTNNNKNEYSLNNNSIAATLNKIIKSLNEKLPEVEKGQ